MVLGEVEFVLVIVERPVGVAEFEEFEVRLDKVIVVLLSL